MGCIPLKQVLLTTMEKSTCSVIDPGFYTSVQDSGRKAWRSFGVPVSGPMDLGSFTKANLCTGNRSPLAGLEITLKGPTLLFNDTVWMALYGAAMPVYRNDNLLPPNTAFRCDLGDILKIGAASQGVRSYLAFYRGLQMPTYLGSASQFYPVTPKGRLVKGDALVFFVGQQKPKNRLQNQDGDFIKRTADIVLCMRKGVDWDQCSEEVKTELETTVFTVGSNNRMGYRLEGALPKTTTDPLSGIVLPGTVQLTPGGTLLVVMHDGQVTGGYLRIGQLTDAAMDFLAQQSTGKKLTIRLVV